MQFVYVVPRGDLFPEFYPHGLHPFGVDLNEAELFARVERAGFFVERSVAERNPDWKQLIPYVVVVREEPDGASRVLLLRRLPRGGEERLHDKLSLGVGGHVEPRDLGAEGARRDLLDHATEREIAEELVLDGPRRVRTVGILNDDSNPVGAVHVGVVRILTIDGHVSVRETDVLEGSLVTAEELRRLRGEGANFETWSSFLLDALDEWMPQPVAAS